MQNTKQTKKNTLIFGPSDPAEIKRRILQSDHSVVVLDNELDLMYDCTAVLTARGYKIWKLDFDDPEYSISYCPFQYLETETDVSRFSYYLYEITNKGSLVQTDGFDHFAETELLGAITHFLGFHRKLYDQNFPSFIKILNVAYTDLNGPEYANPCDMIFDEIGEDNPNDLGFRMYEQFRRANNKNLIVASALSRMMMFNTEEISAITMKEGKLDDLRMLGKNKIALFVRNSENAATETLLPLFFAQLYRTLNAMATMNGGSLPRCVDVYMNHFGSIAKIPDLENSIILGYPRGIRTTVNAKNAREIIGLYQQPAAKVLLSAFPNILYTGDLPLEEGKLTANLILRGEL